MAHLVNLEGVEKSYGTHALLDGVSLGLDSADRIGVVGPNGAGKSTLVDIIAGVVAPDSGRTTRTRDLRIGHLSQHGALPAGATVAEVVLGGDQAFGAEHEWAGDAGVRQVLDGLGLATLGLDTVVDPLSGGERRRVALARLLVHPTDLLLLDEPTNHLDIDGVRWLASYLGARPGGLVVVTHDRWFLDEVCTRTWEVAGGQVHGYDGGYSAYVLARAERMRLAGAAEQRRRNLVRKELAWLRRGAPARTSKPRFRVAAATELIADEPPPRDRLALQTLARHRLGKSVYDAEGVTVCFGGRALLREVTWRIGPGDRIGVVGVNGSGKTTLLRLLAGQLRPDAGIVRVGKTVRPAYLSQVVTELPDRLRVLDAVEEVGRVVPTADGEISASTLLERFGFAAAVRQQTVVGDLSGGQRRRLQLLRLLMAGPNALLLDEPTNDLDIDTLAALEDLLDGYPGTLVVVSHDRYLLERVCDTTVALLGDGALMELPGGVPDYLDRLEVRRTHTVGSAAADKGGPKAGTKASSNGDSRRESRTDSRAARKELTRLERLVARLAAREAELHAELARVATDHVAVAQLAAELRETAAARERAEDEWLLAAEVG